MSGAGPGRMVSGPGTTLPRRLCYTLGGRTSGLLWCPDAVWEMECAVCVVQRFRGTVVRVRSAQAHFPTADARLLLCDGPCPFVGGRLALSRVSVRPSVSLSICPGIRLPVPLRTHCLQVVEPQACLAPRAVPGGVRRGDGV